MKLEINGKVFYVESTLGGGPEGWAETIMKNTLKAEQEEGRICFLVTDGKQWYLLTEYKEPEISTDTIPDISEEYIENDSY